MKVWTTLVLAAALSLSACGDDSTPAEPSADGATVSTTGEEDTSAEDTTSPTPDEGSTGEADTSPPPPEVVVPPADTTETQPPEAFSCNGDAPDNCGVALEWVLNCKNDSECISTCIASADEAIQAELNTVLQCVENDCNGSDTIQCLLGDEDNVECYEQFYSCKFNDQFGEKDCLAITECVVQCGDDAACQSTCLQSGAPQPQKDYATLQFCYWIHCNDAEDVKECQKKVETQECGTQYAHCFDI